MVTSRVVDDQGIPGLRMLLTLGVQWIFVDFFPMDFEAQISWQVMASDSTDIEKSWFAVVDPELLW